MYVTGVKETGDEDVSGTKDVSGVEEAGDKDVSGNGVVAGVISSLLDDVTVVVIVDVTVVVELAPSTMVDVTVDCTAVLLVEVITLRMV